MHFIAILFLYSLFILFQLFFYEYLFFLVIIQILIPLQAVSSDPLFIVHMEMDTQSIESYRCDKT